MRQTSLMAYKDLCDSGQLMPRQRQVLSAIVCMNGGTDREIANFLNFSDPNMVRPRRKELLDKGLICILAVKKCNVSKKQAISWKIKPL